MNQKVTSTLLLAAPALAAAAVMPPAADSNAQTPSGSSASTRVHCGTVAGARWSLSSGPYHYKGNQYVVSTEGGISCSLVRKWVPRLTRQRNPGAGRAVSGPPGFKCTSALPRAIGAKRTVGGGCVNRSTEFQWAPKSKHFSYS